MYVVRGALKYAPASVALLMTHPVGADEETSAPGEEAGKKLPVHVVLLPDWEHWVRGAARTLIVKVMDVTPNLRQKVDGR